MLNHLIVIKRIFSVAMAMLLIIGMANSCTQKSSAPHEIAITTNSDEARQAFLDARELFDKIRFDEAREGFSKAIEKDPNFALAHFYRAITGTSQADFDEHLQHAVSLSTNASEGERLLIESQQANAENNPVKALELTEKLVKMFPEDKRARSFLGNNYIGLNMNDRAIAEFLKVAEIDPNYSSAYNNLGYRYRQLGDYTKAEEAFKKYIQLLPDEANPHDSMADLLTKMGEYEEAIEHYKKAVELNPTFAFSQRKVGDNLSFMGKYDEAREAYYEAMAKEVTETGKAVDMGRVARSYLYENNPQEAINYFDKAIAITKEAGNKALEANLHAGKCRVYIENSDFEAAKKSIAACMAIVDNAELSVAVKENFAKNALFDAAQMDSKMKNYSEAMAKAEAYKQKATNSHNPRDMENYHALMGYVLLDKGDYAKAVEHLKQANPSNPYAMYHLAVAESKAGNAEAAAKSFKKVANWNQSGFLYTFVRGKAMKAAM